MAFVTSKQLCEYLKMHPDILAKLRSKEGLPALRIGKKSYRYELDDVMFWLKERQIRLDQSDKS